MPVNVTFPDGSVAAVPSHPVEIQSKQINGGPSTFIETPNAGPNWLYRAFVGGWLALPKG